VDRIVTLPSDEHPLMKEDPLLIQAEPYALWAIERPRPDWQPPIRHPAIEAVDDLTPYYLRKVRILNGIHTALVGKFMPRGFETVQQALQNPEVMDWVLGLLYEEILPAIAYHVDDIARFARQTLERFANPFLQHRLHHRDKVQVRLQSTATEYERLFGKPPRRLREAMQPS
jgi:tagaturonate reductase